MVYMRLFGVQKRKHASLAGPHIYVRPEELGKMDGVDGIIKSISWYIAWRSRYTDDLPPRSSVVSISHIRAMVFEWITRCSRPAPGKIDRFWR